MVKRILFFFTITQMTNGGCTISLTTPHALTFLHIIRREKFVKFMSWISVFFTKLGQLDISFIKSYLVLIHSKKHFCATCPQFDNLNWIYFIILNVWFICKWKVILRSIYSYRLAPQFSYQKWKQFKPICKQFIIF